MICWKTRMPANWQAGLPELQKTRIPASQQTGKLALDINLIELLIYPYTNKKRSINNLLDHSLTALKCKKSVTISFKIVNDRMLLTVMTTISFYNLLSRNINPPHY